MSTRKIGAIIIGIATLFAIAYTTYKMMSGKDVGFNEIITISILFMMFFSVMAREDKKEKEDRSDELGHKNSAKISYFILLFVILLAVFADQLVNGTVNIFLLAVLGLGMVIFPVVEYLVAKKH
ncbi:hypothetical protein [Bacillus haynesii]|uniref:hypothetical protein n=1 Tax=Bacillus haynesii TaxID=1925021 RepID=UPI0003ED9E2E|nr:hypothetical protein [Bacillus haynesii]EWH22270.1 hypothetical protein M769_0109540 [Bacillus haynesii]